MELNEMNGMETTATTEMENAFGTDNYDVVEVAASHPNYAMIAGGIAAGAAAVGGAIAVGKKVKQKIAEKKAGKSDNVKTRKRLCFRNPFFVKEEAIVDITNVQQVTPEQPTEATPQQ